jgi:hypothetical protein
MYVVVVLVLFMLYNVAIHNVAELEPLGHRGQRITCHVFAFHAHLPDTFTVLVLDLT